MAGERGFEPLKAEPESAVIPLHHSPKYKALNQQVVYINYPVWSILTIKFYEGVKICWLVIIKII
jgi:hypothetical protein